MPESVQDQTISKRYGTPILDSMLPLDDDRRIYVDGSGCCSISYFEQHAEELLDYYLDFMRFLEPNEVMIGAAIWCDPDNLIATRLEYASTGVVAWLTGGGDDVRQTINLQISTSLGKIKLVQFVVKTTGIASDLAFVTADNIQVYVGDNDGDAVIPDPEPILNAYPPVISFPVTMATIGHSSQPVVIKNDGQAVAFIRNIAVEGQFSQRNSGITRIEPGEFVQLTVNFNPKTIGEHTGSISIDIGDGLAPYVTMSGTAVSSSRLLVSGNQLIRPGGETFRLKSINWFGAESDVYTPHGLWTRNYKEIIDQIVAMGFNSVRIPFSGDICNELRSVSSGAINYSINEDLADKTAIEVLDAIIAYMNESKLYVILDHHRRVAGSGADGSPVSETYSINAWTSSWLFMADRYSEVEFVLGADLHNEPHLLDWNTWASYAEIVGNALLSVANRWLIFVEGVGSYGAKNYWWGGELSGVRVRPVNLSIDDRLVYSVHEYGISVGSQPWLAQNTTVPQNWPYNLYSVWRDHWGFIFEEGIAPIWIGEVGGKFGVDGSGNIVSDNNAQFERQWIYHLQRYIDGYFTGSGTRSLNDDQKGMSFAYWSLNPNSGDTGGILCDDWTTEQIFKLELIGMMLSDMSLPNVFGLSPLDYSAVDDSSQIIISQDGFDYAINLTSFKDAMRMRIYEVGEVHFFAQSVDVAARYVGQQWVRVPGEDRTIRISASDDSDIGSTGGSDSITIAKTNLPAVQLSVTGTAASVDLGSKVTSSNGAHSHTAKMGGDNNGVRSASGSGAITTSSDAASGGTDGTGQIASAADHTHTVTLGAHSHSVSGQTETMGSAAAITVKNKFITLAAWYRVS